MNWAELYSQEAKKPARRKWPQIQCELLRSRLLAEHREEVSGMNDILKEDKKG